MAVAISETSEFQLSAAARKWWRRHPESGRDERDHRERLARRGAQDVRLSLEDAAPERDQNGSARGVSTSEATTAALPTGLISKGTN